MTELFAKEPKLAAVREKASGRDLLVDPAPIVADCTTGRSAEFSLMLENGPEGLIQLAITADQPWVQANRAALELLGSEVAELRIQVHASGAGEFANLRLAWPGAIKERDEFVLVMRKVKGQETQTGPTQSGSNSGTGTVDKPAGGKTKPIPDWMK